MKIIDLKLIIESCDLHKKTVAELLFPSNKFPELALNRVISGESELDAGQISKLALYSGLSISQLFTGDGWKAKTVKGINTFTNGEFSAELDRETWTTKIFHKKSMFHESVLHSGSTPLSEYLANLDILILKFKENESIKD